MKTTDISEATDVSEATEIWYAKPGSNLRDDAAAAYTRFLDETRTAEEIRDHRLSLLAENAFVKRFGYAPDRVIVEERTIELEGLLFYYHLENNRIAFAMLGTCKKCHHVDPERVSCLASIGRILAHGLQYHDCTAPGAPTLKAGARTEEPGPEDRLIAALAEFVENYTP